MANWEILTSEKLSYIEHAASMKNEWFPMDNVNEEITALLEMWVSPDWNRELAWSDELFISHANKMQEEWFTDDEIYDEIYALKQRNVAPN